MCAQLLVHSRFVEYRFVSWLVLVPQFDADLTILRSNGATSLTEDGAQIFENVLSIILHMHARELFHFPASHVSFRLILRQTAKLLSKSVDKNRAVTDNLISPAANLLSASKLRIECVRSIGTYAAIVDNAYRTFHLTVFVRSVHDTIVHHAPQQMN